MIRTAFHSKNIKSALKTLEKTILDPSPKTDIITSILGDLCKLAVRAEEMSRL